MAPAATPGARSVATEDTKDDLPKLPRNIRALRDGKNGKVSGRTIVVLLDGTGDKFDADNSNIVHLVSCLKKADPSQVSYYQSGIGTYDAGGLSNGMKAAMDMAVGSGLGVHIRDAYQFLTQNYHDGDRICLFGFSRGAYTARCLAGMIHKVGLLPAYNSQQIQFAYQYYKDDSETGWKMSGEFKSTFCMDVSVHSICVFDSVSSVGFIPRTLPLSSTPYNKSTYFRHAMALDEHRAKFKACRFQKRDSTQATAHWETMAEIHQDAINGEPVRRFSANLGARRPYANEFEKDLDSEGDALARKRRMQAMQKETDVKEVWFAGAHCDIGGGAVKNEVRHKLAQIPLRWMIRQCFECDTGILFKAHALAAEGLDVHTLWPTYHPLDRPHVGPPPALTDRYEGGQIHPIARRSTALKPPEGLHIVDVHKDESRRELHEHWVPEHVEDYFDAMSPINDQLEKSKAWWILEVLPVEMRLQNKKTQEWYKAKKMNLGLYRPVQDASPNLHWTVQQRQQELGYKTRVRVDKNASWNVVV
ncbi:hypothetical protein EJ03DRAFT_387383 [Teratosphaeria nubilosa]|uniref:T6SS Phospholipase effector Tle1-like catalytic domain-containing protein n=1 Tax=Teratosphaeria nubilosa TaxID=161662 RepID=A0A6G1LJQ0_9PEZI|nr:hypothetical protein EJ03DRAFT_387383 [Teratosphaeria nubilosa]